MRPHNSILPSVGDLKFGSSTSTPTVGDKLKHPRLGEFTLTVIKPNNTCQVMLSNNSEYNINDMDRLLKESEFISSSSSNNTNHETITPISIPVSTPATSSFSSVSSSFTSSISATSISTQQPLDLSSIENLIPNSKSEFSDNINRVISLCPDMIKQQFAKIVCYYIGFTGNSEFKPTNQDRVIYTNNIMNAISMLAKIACIASDGTPADELSMPEDKAIKSIQEAFGYLESHLPKSVSINEGIDNPEVDATVSTNIIEDTNTSTDTTMVENNEFNEEYNPNEVIDLFKSELNNWGIRESLLSYRIISELPKYGKSSMSGKDGILAASEYFDKSKQTIYSSIYNLIRTANFGESKLIPKFAKIEFTDINPESLIREFLDFCE